MAPVPFDDAGSEPEDSGAEDQLAKGSESEDADNSHDAEQAVLDAVDAARQARRRAEAVVAEAEGSLSSSTFGKPVRGILKAAKPQGPTSGQVGMGVATAVRGAAAASNTAAVSEDEDAGLPESERLRLQRVRKRKERRARQQPVVNPIFGFLYSKPGKARARWPERVLAFVVVLAVLVLLMGELDGQIRPKLLEVLLGIVPEEYVRQPVVEEELDEL
eukprot:gnl/TRDRNA2_/TRDRNA2_153610_c0_seq1.p1 gnl/TRDRNA2_/TRDRNA2_153610_c0~~gnl/TRDRNA2_/TRDRNA2_153610_c0_seq1.p1  ORF type:complete len:218 (-),score=52.94 gnl/TRDRNA2_/TRDRNA2_153610_c0_seq1:164-817(-)